MNFGGVSRAVMTAIALAALSGSAAAQSVSITSCSSGAFSIITPGEYSLSNNVTAATGAPCIKVSASRVYLKLNGFTIAASPGNSGILAVTTVSDLSISTGRVSGGAVGINAPISAVNLEKVVASGQSQTAAVLGDNAHVYDSEFLNSAGDGLDVGARATIFRSTFAGNAANAVKTGAGAGIALSSASTSTAAGSGFVTGGASSVSECAADGPGGSTQTGYGFKDISGGTTYSADSAQGFKAGFLVTNAALSGNNATGNGDGFIDQGLASSTAGSSFDNNNATLNTFDGFANSIVSTGPAPASSFVHNHSSSNGNDGFDVLCPSNLIGNTARGNTVANSNVTVSTPGTCHVSADNLF